VVKERTYYGDAINELLFEYGYVANIDPSGVVQIFDLAPSSVASTQTLSPANANMLGTYTSTRKEDQYQAVDATWTGTYTYPGPVVIHNDTTCTSGSVTLPGNGCNIVLANAQYYPNTASATQDIYADYMIPNYQIIAVNPANTSMNFTYSGTGTLLQSAPANAEETRCKIKFLSASGGTVITNLQIIASSVICVGDTSVSSFENITNSQKREADTLQYVFDATTANRFISCRASYFANSHYTYGIQSNIYSINPGDYVTLNDTITGINQLCRVIQVVDGNNLEYSTIQIEGFAAVTIQTPTAVGITQTSVPTAPVVSVTNIQNGSQNINVATATGTIIASASSTLQGALVSGGQLTSPNYVSGSSGFMLKSEEHSNLIKVHNQGSITTALR